MIGLLIVLCFVLAMWSWLKPRSVTLPPLYPGCLPIIGHAHKIIGDAKYMWEFEKNVYETVVKNSKIAEFRFGTHPLYVITDPDDSLIVANHCLEKPYLYDFLYDTYRRGLVTAKVNTWKPHRKLLNPAFNLQVLQSFVGEFCAEAKLLVASLASEVGKGPFDVQPYLVTNFLGTACRTTFGPNFEEKTEVLETYVHATDEIFELFMKRVQNVWLHLSCIYQWTTSYKKYHELAQIVQRITRLAVTNRKTELKQIKDLDKDDQPATESCVSLLDRMLEWSEKQDVFTDEEIREHLDTMVAAAYDTTATSLTFILVMIGSHHDVQERMFQELQEVLGDLNRDITRADLPKLVYMEAVIKETLRLYPPVPRIARTSSSDVKLKNYILPAKSTYLIAVYGLHRHPMWGPDRHQFIPERWLDPARSPKNPNLFAGFSLGKRNCIGRLYGMMAIKTTLAYILRQYRVQSNAEKLETQCDLLMKPASGYEMSFESRVS